MPLQWNAAYNELIPLLAGLYPDREQALFVLRRAELDPTEIELAGAPRILWLRIVEQANRRDAVGRLLAVAHEDYPNLDLAALERELREPRRAPAHRLEEPAWKGPPTAVGRLEKVIGAQPTFLPVSFLETGLLRARTVARVESPAGLGTGFLAGRDLLITNHHVIGSAEEARQSRVWFNYQEAASGALGAVEELGLEPASAFATSAEDDWTAVRVAGGPAARWGSLELAEADVHADDFVNVVQHPGGMPKQIALYHNTVAYADERRVQYLTDTMPGSSGSPVFDSRWRLVALHHSGGWLPEPGTGRVFFRNEGIHVRALIAGLRDRGLLDG